jgi:acetolactate synthase small subunit
MWFSNVLIVVNRNNADRNGLLDIAAAVADTGTSVVNVDEDRFIIEAAAPSEVIPTIQAMEGVTYVRCVFSYLIDPTPAKAA